MVAFLFFITNISASEVRLTERKLPDRYDECNLCHLKKKLEFIPSKHKPNREHNDYPLRHSKSEMSCNSCHDINNFNFLKSSKELSASFENSSPVCQRCHSEVFRDWRQGIHGKRSGEWMGKKIQNQCIDCHDPHSVKYKSVKARSAPVRPAFGVKKGSD